MPLSRGTVPCVSNYINMFTSVEPREGTIRIAMSEETVKGTGPDPMPGRPDRLESLFILSIISCIPGPGEPTACSKPILHGQPALLVASTHDIKRLVLFHFHLIVIVFILDQQAGQGRALWLLFFFHHRLLLLLLLYPRLSAFSASSAVTLLL